MKLSVCLVIAALVCHAPSADAYLSATSGVELLARPDTFVWDGQTISDEDGWNLPYETDTPIGLLLYGAFGMSDFEITLPACENPRFICEVFEVEFSEDPGVVLRLEALDPELALPRNVGNPVMLGTFEKVGAIVPSTGLVEDVLGIPWVILDDQGTSIPATFSILAPEPASGTLLLGGLAALLGLSRRRQAN